MQFHIYLMMKDDRIIIIITKRKNPTNKKNIFLNLNLLISLFAFQVENKRFMYYQLYSKMMLNDDPKGGQQANGMSFKKLNKQNEENRELKSSVQQLKMEITQKDIKIREIELERYKTIKPLQEEIKKLKNDHKQQLQKQKATHGEELKRLTEKWQAESQRKIEVLSKENEDLKQQIELQKGELKKAFDLEISILRTNGQREKQTMRIQMQNEKNEAFAASKKKEKQIIFTAKQDQESLKNKYDSDLAQLIEKSGKEIEFLKVTLTSQKAQAKEQYEKLKISVDQRLNMQTQKIRQSYQKEKGMMRGSFIDQKAELESQLQAINDEINRRITEVNSQKSKIVQDYQAEVVRLKKNIQNLEKKIDQDRNQIQQLFGEKQRLSSHLTSYDKSLGFYQEEINQFDSFIQKNNNHLVQQFKIMDDLYPQPSVEKMQLTHLMIKQYKQLVRLINHPIMIKTMNEKQKILSNYVGTQMMTFIKIIDDINPVDFYSLGSDKGKKFARVIQKINLFKSLDSANINDTIDMYFSKKLFQKVKNILTIHENIINSKNDENGQLQFIINVQIFYQLQEFLSLQFPQHKICCQAQYNSIHTSIIKGFNRFNQKYSRIQKNKPVQKLQDYVERSQELKKFVIVLHGVKNHRKYSYNLQKNLDIKLDDVKTTMLERLNEDKKALKPRVQGLLQSRIYYDCFLHQRIFKKLRIFDDVLTKEQNSYYNFNFTQFYNKIINLLKIIREQKINLAGIILTEQKINVAEFGREYAAIAFDVSIKGLYRQKLKNIMQSRTSFVEKINQNSLITNRMIDQFESYYLESLQLNNIKQISDIPQVANHSELYDSKVSHFLVFMQLKFKQYYHNSSEYKQLTENGRNIKNTLQFQEFLLQEFKHHHQNLKNIILENRYSKLPQTEDENQCVFRLLVRLNEENRIKLQSLINTPEDSFTQDHFDYYTNMTASVSKYECGKLQQKMDRYVEDCILQLQAKEWLQGDLNSIYQRKLLGRINKLVNKDIALYRQQINIRKNKIIQERQRIVNSEKRMLKEGQFEKLKQFVMECQKHEASKSKFSKLYINILQEYLSYVYESLSDDGDKKSQFAETIYKLNLINSTKYVREIFMVKEHNLHFYKPELFNIKENVQLIQKFQGQSQVNISQAAQKLFGAFKLYSIIKRNWAKSLLQDGQKNSIDQQIGSIRYEVIKSYLALCRSVQQQNLFDENCDRRKLLLTFIKIQIYLRLMKKMQTISPQQGYYENIEQYKKIIDKSNNNLQKIFEEIKKFRFCKEELIYDYEDNEKVLENLLRIQRFIQVFKDTRYNLHKLDDYLKNNYLQGLKIIKIDYKQVVLIIEMAWIKQYAVVKKEVADMFSNNNWQVTDKYRLILIEKDLVKQHSLLYFNQFIKEEYDFKKGVIQQLMLIEGKSQRYIQELEKQNQFYNQHIRKLQQNRKTYIDTQKERIRSKYAKLIAEVRNSFHQIQSQKARQKKIESEINTLKNQQRTEEEKLLDYEVKNIDNTRVKAKQKLKRWVSKIFYITSIVRNVQKSFDKEIEQICHRIEGKIQEQIDKQDKNIRNAFASHEKRFSNKEIDMGAINISQHRATQSAIQDAKSQIENHNQLRVHTEYHDEQSELKTQAIQIKSRSNHKDKISSKSSEKYEQKSMINIEAPQESENQVRNNKEQIKVNIIQPTDKPRPKQKEEDDGLKIIIERCPQIKNNQMLIQKISENYDEYSTQLKRVQDDYRDHKSQSRLLKMVNQTRQSANSLSMPKLLARIFAVNSIYELIDSDQTEIDFNGNPHTNQVAAAFLLTESHTSDKFQLVNRLIQLKPGEGKSRLLAGVSVFLALKGYKVYCGTFSNDLSERDKQQFKKLYQCFGVEEKIAYGPVYNNCLSVFDRQEMLKEVLKKSLLGQKMSSQEICYLQALTEFSKRNPKTNSILLVDEADILFRTPFGQVDPLNITIDSPEVKKLIKFIWTNRNNDKLAKIIKNSEQYTALMTKNSKISEILQNQVQLMIKNTNSYRNCSYKIQGKQIIPSKVQKPAYGILFAACFQFQNGKLTEKNYNKHLAINLKMGQISYSQLPKIFDHILAVTGSIGSLSEYRRQFLKQQLRINETYTLPSKFDEKNKKIIGYSSCQNDQYIKMIAHRIQQMKKNGRPTLIVLQSQEELNSFANAAQLAQYSADTYKISESSTLNTRNSLISYAGSGGRITLTTYKVARGGDFMVYNSEINEKGGLHVIQAYLPGQQEEFSQICGRAARQGITGSYQMIITIDMLAKKQMKQVDDAKLLDSLKNYWKNSAKKQGQMTQNIIKKAKSEHQATVQILGLNDPQKMYQSVMRWNYVETNSQVIHTVIAIDATGPAAGSMGIVVNAFVNVIKEAITQTDQIIKQKNRKAFHEHKIIFFRNYNSKYQKLIEQSRFTKDASELQAFVATIKAEGGLGNQAHQVLFYELGKLSESQKIDQIILIGDAGGNKYDQIVKYRKKFSGEAYWSSKVPLLPKIESYIEKIKKKEIPIHSMYILKNKPESAQADKNTKTYFQNLSQGQNGLCKELFVGQKEQVSNQLTGFIVSRVLSQMGLSENI